MHQLSSPHVNFTPHGCIACWRCVEACPKQVIGKVKFLFHKHAAIAHAEACIGCQKCVKACPRHCFTAK
ncbi:MAG: 4Fe-4S binding protein [Bacteroides sp.]|nr:4Fe-4S binding protein [Ruminococcus flavefaciens]MCM1555607.1 4Fe-4S binding protein [Bacteroides sp.]